MGFGRRFCLVGERVADQYATKIRFLAAGALNTVFGLTAYPALFYLFSSLELHYLAILAVSQIVCVLFAYITNKFLVFRTAGNYLSEFGRFIAFHLSYFLVNLAALPFFVEVLGMNPVWAQTGFAGLVIVTSYFWHSRVTFRVGKVVH